MATKNPFLDFDPTKFFDMNRLTDFQKAFTEFKLPSPDFEGVVAAQRRNVEAIVAANQLAVEGYQAVARRQAEIIRQSLEETSTIISELMTPGTPEDKVAKQAALVKASFEKASANLKELSELVAKSNSEAAEVLSKRVKESIEELQGVLAKVTPKKG
ncbi:phasin family protein [Niveispirillum cyanobacteriorum]|uniref:Phasin n=1 Tax=Niveispirillum cyanobacteriorum TaxID=1612173 RepID=A0A2K9N7Y4_9PROT|nr:phasin family protein [Niveispirillum cyanobacteriorum]AUN29189.1 phasin [Niveispirillum cyanobacteriorum]GGE66641.1 phasin [Niveispirillum cyanobacteriorum]